MTPENRMIPSPFPRQAKQVLPKYSYFKTCIQVYCNPNQNINSIPHRTRGNSCKIPKELEETQNSKSNPGQQEHSRRHHTIRLQILLQSNSDKNGMILARKQTCKSVARWIQKYCRILGLQSNIHWNKDSQFFQCHVLNRPSI